MPVSKIQVSCDPATTLRGMALIAEVIDPEIQDFEAWFSRPEVGKTPLTSMERELLRSYLYQKIRGRP